MTREEKVARARELREQGLTYREIGERFGVTHSAVVKWLNPERSREYNRRDLARPERGEQKRAWENAHDRQPCASCDQPRGAGSHRGARGELCWECYSQERAASRRARCSRIAALWAEGKSLRAIAAELETTVGSVGVAMAAMRDEGYDLPYRYTTGKRAGRKFPEQVAA